MVARHDGDLRRTALRYSLCGDDADDAYQRALEILLVKAPTDDPRELIRWTQTVVKHEALAVRKNRERLLGGPRTSASGVEPDWMALIPAEGSDPAERVERSEAIARSREALQTLKPQELRALTLLAAGYSYAEIGRLTGYSQTKVNRCLAEGRERFRQTVAGSDDGSRCDAMRPLLSAFCDGEAGERDVATLREHLRACAGCRSTMRTYRAAPRAAAALAPVLPASRSLLERAHETLVGLQVRLPGHGGGGDAAVSQVAAGGTRGVGVAALAKVLAICVGSAGGAAACVAGGIAPIPLDLGPDSVKPPALERPAKRITDSLTSESSVVYEPAPAEPSPQPPEPKPAPKPAEVSRPESSTTGAVEFSPEAAPAVTPAASEESTSGSDSAAGEFGP